MCTCFSAFTGWDVTSYFICHLDFLNNGTTRIVSQTSPFSPLRCFGRGVFTIATEMKLQQKTHSEVGLCFLVPWTLVGGLWRISELGAREAFEC